MFTKISAEDVMKLGDNEKSFLPCNQKIIIEGIDSSDVGCTIYIGVKSSGELVYEGLNDVPLRFTITFKDQTLLIEVLFARDMDITPLLGQRFATPNFKIGGGEYSFYYSFQDKKAIES